MKAKVSFLQPSLFSSDPRFLDPSENNPPISSPVTASQFKGSRLEKTRAIQTGGLLVSISKPVTSSEIARAYWEALGRYYRVGGWRWKKNTSKRWWGIFSKAASLFKELVNESKAEQEQSSESKEAALSLEIMIKGIFLYAHHRFGRPALWWELTQKEAMQRGLAAYREAESRGQKKEVICLRVVQAKQIVSQQRQDLLEEQYDGLPASAWDKQLSDLCKAWGSESEVWTMFGDPSDYQDLFPLSYRKTRETWRRIFEKSEV